MWGETERWCPWDYVREQHPDVQVYEVELPGGLLGCIDHERRIIWLQAGIGDVQLRCTLAFEVAHLERGPTPAQPELARARQNDAEDWAARQLIPTNCLVFAFLGFTHLKDIAVELGVDLPMLRARLRGLTDDEQDAVMDAIRGIQAVA
ncbi:MAG: 42, gp42 [Streptosporangiaceae bacterium]|nr:42, gp42 [Streptosporangiaceae bacterium]